MDNEGMNVHIFKEAVASIADSLEKMSDHMTADPFKKAFDEYRKAREEELRV